MTAAAKETDALREQAEEAEAILENYLIAYGENMSRDEKRSLLMCIHRLQRGLDGQRGTDPSRTLANWIAS